jgi:hypothetical protein
MKTLPQVHRYYQIEEQSFESNANNRYINIQQIYIDIFMVLSYKFLKYDS